MSLGKGEVRWLIRLIGVTPRKVVESSSFNHRLKVQKATFLLNHLRVKPFTDYAFNFYLHGPYSSSLAKDYYDLENTNAKPVQLNARNMKILKWFISKNETWLEIASSIISIRDGHADATNEEIYSTLTLSKPWISGDMFKSVMTEFATQGL